MDEKRLKELLARYIDGACTDAERALVEDWYERFHTQAGGNEHRPFPEHELWEDLAAIRAELPTAVVRPRRLRGWLPYAAAVAAMAVVGAWFIVGDQVIGLSGWLANKSGHPHTQDIGPGGNRATLTLADGRTIELSAEQAGVVMGDGITYLDGSAVLGKQAEGGGRDHRLTGSQVHILTTPKGGTYRMTLPDGTAVWLNAASRLEYHEDPNANLRIVQLDGEAFFEVKSDKDRPFKVVTKGQEVEVLGTSFNINSYSDEPTIRTTLVEGVVKVKGTATQHAVVLKPGQQAILGHATKLEVSEVTVADFVAWKSGMFSFNNTSIEGVMRQLSRWYDVAVVFEGDSPQINLWGEVYRDVNASEALAILQFFGLQYRVEQQADAKRIVIYNENEN